MIVFEILRANAYEKLKDIETSYAQLKESFEKISI